MTTAELLEAYRKAAMCNVIEQTGRYKMANKAYDEGVRLSHYFRRGGPEMQQAFLVLLDDVEPAVRLCAAIHALEIAPDKSLRVLRVLASGPPSLVRLNADMALQQWNAGKLLPLP